MAKPAPSAPSGRAGGLPSPRLGPQGATGPSRGPGRAVEALRRTGGGARGARATLRMHSARCCLQKASSALPPSLPHAMMAYCTRGSLREGGWGGRSCFWAPSHPSPGRNSCRRGVAGTLPSWPSPPPLRRPAVPVASLAPVWDLREPRGPREGLAGPWRRCDAPEAARGVHGPHSACTRRGAAYKKHLRPFLPPCLML